MQIVTANRTVTTAARVLRCSVWALHPTDGASYRGALHFDEACDIVWEHDSHSVTLVPEPPLVPARRQGHALPGPSGGMHPARRASGR